MVSLAQPVSFHSVFKDGIKATFLNHFDAEYFRGNKADGVKHMRCFPTCYQDCQHIHQGFCGETISVLIEFERYLSNILTHGIDEITVVGEIHACEQEAEVTGTLSEFGIQRQPASDKIRYIVGKKAKIETVNGNIALEVTFTSKPWQYSWLPASPCAAATLAQFQHAFYVRVMTNRTIDSLSSHYASEQFSSTLSLLALFRSPVFTISSQKPSTNQAAVSAGYNSCRPMNHMILERFQQEQNLLGLDVLLANRPASSSSSSSSSSSCCQPRHSLLSATTVAYGGSCSSSSSSSSSCLQKAVVKQETAPDEMAIDDNYMLLFRRSAATTAADQLDSSNGNSSYSSSSKRKYRTKASSSSAKKSKQSTKKNQSSSSRGRKLANKDADDGEEVEDNNEEWMQESDDHEDDDDDSSYCNRRKKKQNKRRAYRRLAGMSNRSPFPCLEPISHAASSSLDQEEEEDDYSAGLDNAALEWMSYYSYYHSGSYHAAEQQQQPYMMAASARSLAMSPLAAALFSSSSAASYSSSSSYQSSATTTREDAACLQFDADVFDHEDDTVTDSKPSTMLSGGADDCSSLGSHHPSSVKVKDSSSRCYDRAVYDAEEEEEMKEIDQEGEEHAILLAAYQFHQQLELTRQEAEYRAMRNSFTVASCF